jgi:flagellar motor switch protein FliM
LSEILSQAEIEALLNSLTPEMDSGGGMQELQATPVATPGSSKGQGALQVTQRGTARNTLSFEVYDFRRPDKFSKDQLRTLQMLHETFARLAGSSLSAFLRAPVTIDLISLEQVPYEEYLRSINQSVFTIMSLPPLTGQAVLEIEFGLIFTMIDRLLGGPGKAINRSVLTDIERPLVRQCVERMFLSLKSAWEGVVIVNPGIEGMETSAQFVQIAPPNDIVVTILFEVRIGNQRSAMSLCIPYLVLKPITAKLSAQKWFASNNRNKSSASRKQIVQSLSSAKIDCSVILGKAPITVRELLTLRAGDVLKLDQHTQDELEMLIGNVPKYEGKAAQQGKKVVFAISDAIQEQ